MVVVVIVVMMEVMVGVVHFVNDRSARHEEHALGHGVVEQVEQGGTERHDHDAVVDIVIRIFCPVGQVVMPVHGVGEVERSAQSGEDVSELRHRRVCKDLLQIVLNERNGRRHHGRGATDGCDDERQIRQFAMEVVRAKEGEHAGHEVKPGVDHRCGVDEGGDGRWALHGVGQPYVKRELRGFANRPDEHQPEGPGKGSRAALGNFLDVSIVKDHGVIQTALPSTCVGVEQRPQHRQADHQEDVAHPGGQEGFLGGVSGAGSFVVEPDEQVGTKPHQFPENEQPEERIGQNHAEHAGAEQNEFCVEAVVAVVVDGVGVHVADGKEVDEKAKEGSDEQQHHGDVVNVDAKTEGQRGRLVRSRLPNGGCKPRPAFGIRQTGAADEVRHQPQGEEEASRHDGQRDEAAFLETVFPEILPVEHLAEKEDERESKHRQQHDKGGVIHRSGVNEFLCL